MSNFVLVHGAWQGAWAWDRVIEEMESDGVVQVLTPDLPGHGQRFADEIRRITMEHYIHAVATLVQVERIEDVVLVGHGFAGTFLPQVAMGLGERVKQVVFIAGDLPPEGKSAYNRLPRRDKLMLWAFKAREKGFKFPNFIFTRLLCDGLDRDSSRRLLSRLVPEPFLPWLAPVSRQGFTGNFPTTYVILTQDKLLPPRLQRQHSQSLRPAEGAQPLRVEELQAGHGAPLTHPGDVARLLLRYV